MRLINLKLEEMIQYVIANKIVIKFHSCLYLLFGCFDEPSKSTSPAKLELHN